MKTPQQILNEAADLLDKPDVYLFKGSGTIDDDGNVVMRNVPCFCALTSLMTVTKLNEYEYEEAKILFAVHVGIGANDITLWNDVPERRKADVVAALREAAR